MKKFLLCLCLLLVTGCGQTNTTPETTFIGNGKITIPVYEIKAPEAGKILGLIVEEGERLSQGQPMFAIEQPALDKKVEEATTLLAREQAQLKNMEYGSSQAVLNSASYSLESSKTIYQTATEHFQKMSALYSQGAIARIKLQQAELDLQQAKATVDAALAHQQQLMAKATPEALAAQKNYDQLILQQQANEVINPCTGVITQKLLENGTLAEKNQHLLTIRATEQCHVKISVTPQQAKTLLIGQPVIAETSTLTKTFSGTILEINANNILINLENPLSELQDSMTVKINLKNK